VSVADADLRVGPLTREHPGLVVSGAYLAATGVGMLSSWTFYRQFDIDIFHYAQLGDFLLAALRTPLATVAIALAVPAVWLIRRFDDFCNARLPWYKYLYGPARFQRMARSPAAMVVYFLLYAYFFSVLYSNWMGARIRAGDAPGVTVQLQAGMYLGRDATLPFASKLLGTTSSFVFLYDEASASATVVPVENIALMIP